VAAKPSVNPGFYELMANLILTGDLPMNGIADAGEIITLDARSMDYDSPFHKAMSLMYKGSLLDDYEILLERCGANIRQFSESQDIGALLRNLSEIKLALAELYARAERE
jgi:hypothetical protein